MPSCPTERSTITLFFVPDFARSVGLGPFVFPPNRVFLRRRRLATVRTS
jgi:hypothetical protein